MLIITYIILVQAMIESCAGHNSTIPAALQRYCPQRGTRGFVYSEQLVLFESLAYYLDDPLLYYDSTAGFDPLRFAYDAPCEVIDAFLRSLDSHGAGGSGIDTRVLPFTARDLGCEGHARTIHLYSAIQPFKKLHPLFDKALSGILAADPYARILVTRGARFLTYRWMRLFNITKAEINQRFVFLPRIPHDQNLKLLSLV